MAHLTDDIRRVLEDQLAIGGRFVPLPKSEGQRESGKGKAARGKWQAARRDLSLESPKATGVERVQQAGGTDQLDFDAADSASRTPHLEPDPWSRLRSLIPSESPLLQLDTIDEVAEYVADNTLIPLDETRLNPVPGVGNPNADLMVIGEAPGADEDRKGEPFVGRAGQLLDKILAAIDFDRSDVFIANILKSRPPRNRDPEPEEIEAHLPILLRQMTIVKPKLILCVGRVSGNVLLERKTSLKALRQGNFHDFHGIPLMVTYHPAALLRSAQYKRPTWDDVQALRQRYDELVEANV